MHFLKKTFPQLSLIGVLFVIQRRWFRGARQRKRRNPKQEDARGGWSVERRESWKAELEIKYGRGLKERRVIVVGRGKEHEEFEARKQEEESLLLTTLLFRTIFCKTK